MTMNFAMLSQVGPVRNRAKARVGVKTKLHRLWWTGMGEVMEQIWVGGMRCDALDLSTLIITPWILSF